MIGRETLPILARLLVRQGHPDADRFLAETVRHAERADVLEWLVPAGLARARARLAGRAAGAGRATIRPCCSSGPTAPARRVWRAEVLRYLRRLGHPVTEFAGCPEEYAPGCAATGRRRRRPGSGPAIPYERALELAESGSTGRDDRGRPTARCAWAPSRRRRLVRGRLRDLGVTRMPRAAERRAAQQRRGTHRPAGWRSCGWSRRACPTPRSPSGSWSPPGRSTITSPPCCQAGRALAAGGRRPARLARPRRVSQPRPDECAAELNNPARGGRASEQIHRKARLMSNTSQPAASHAAVRVRPAVAGGPSGDPSRGARRVRAVSRFRSATVLYRRYLADLLDVDRHARDGQLLVAEVDGVVLGSGAFYPDASIQGLGWPRGWAGGRALAVHPRARAARRRPGPARRLRAAGSRARCAGLRVPHRQPDDRSGRPLRAPRLLPSASTTTRTSRPTSGSTADRPSTLSPTTASSPTRPTPSASARPNTQPKGSPHDQSTHPLLDQLRHRGHRPLVRRGPHRSSPAGGDHR